MERMQVYFMSVQFDKSQMAEMENGIKEFFERNNVKITVPVDVFKVASSLGFDVRGTEFREPLEGLLLINEEIEKIPGFDSNKVIAYNCKKDINLKKFIVAHELAHYIHTKNASQDRKIVLAARDHEDEYSSNIDEQKMDYMAAAILMPEFDILENFPVVDEDTDILNLIKNVVERYNVSDIMAERRIKEVLNG